METVLGHRLGFFGLVAEGWDLTDFGSPWPRGPLPTNMDPSELIVGYIDMQRSMGAEMSAEETRSMIAEFYTSRGVEAPKLALSDEELTRIRATMSDLFARWDVTPPGGTLELAFEPGLANL